MMASKESLNGGGAGPNKGKGEDPDFSKIPFTPFRFGRGDCMPSVYFGGVGGMMIPPTSSSAQSQLLSQQQRSLSEIMNLPQPQPAPPSSSGGIYSSPNIQFPFQRGQLIKLEKGEENGVMPGSPRSVAAATPEAEALVTKATYKKSRNLFNKLNPDNFDEITPFFTGLPLGNNDERFSNFVGVMFEKAIERPPMSFTYARMLHVICQASPDPEETSKKFTQKIQQHCHKEFMESSVDKKEIRKIECKLTHSKDNDKLSQQLKVVLDKRTSLSRKKTLGIYKLLGELYQMELLPPKIMVGRANALLSMNQDEECLECLCVLLTDIGRILEEDLKASAASVSEAWDGVSFIPEPNWMDKVFKKLGDALKGKNQNVSAGLRSAITKVIQLRGSGWGCGKLKNLAKKISVPGIANHVAVPGSSKGSWSFGTAAIPTSVTSSTPEPSKPTPYIPPSRRVPSTGAPVAAPATTATTSTTSVLSIPLTSLPRKDIQDQESRASPPHVPPSIPTTGLSTCETVLDAELAKAALTLQQLSDPGIDANMEKKLKLLKYIRECAQTMESLTVLRKALDVEIDNRNKAMAISKAFELKHLPPSNKTDQVPVGNSGGSQPVPVPGSANVWNRPATATTMTNETLGDSLNPRTDGNAFQEYLNCKNLDEALALIKTRFMGNQVEEFIDQLARQLVESSKEVEPRLAGSIIRFLISKREIKGIEVIQVMARGVIKDLPTILGQSPKAPANLAKLLVELFSEHTNLVWLLQVGELLIQSGTADGVSAWRQLAVNCLNVLKSRKDEAHVETVYNRTEGNHVIPIYEIPWLAKNGPLVDALADRLAELICPSENSNVSK